PPGKLCFHEAGILDLQLNRNKTPGRMRNAEYKAALPSGKEATVSLHRELGQRSRLANAWSYLGGDRAFTCETPLPAIGHDHRGGSARNAIVLVRTIRERVGQTAKSGRN